MAEVAESSRRQKKRLTKSNRAQFRKLLRGEQLEDGLFATVRLEDENEQESCVVRLGDLKAKANKMDNWNWERFVNVKGSKDAARDREKLDAQMKRLVKTIRKDQARKPNNESNLEKFEAVVEELGKESLLPSE